MIGSGFLIFDFFRIFWSKNGDFGPKLAKKSEKSRKIKNPLPIIYSPCFGLPIARKPGFSTQN
jgi:hypothetical protein